MPAPSETASAAAPGPVRAAPDLVVTLPGHPRGKGRPRSTFIPKSAKTGKGGFISTYTDSETRSYEAMLKYAGEQAMAGRPLFGGALRVRVTALFSVPESWSQKKKREALSGVIRPTGKPDWDNLAKVLDAFNQVVWTDDAQIVDGRVVKAYADKAALEVEIYLLRLRELLL